MDTIQIRIDPQTKVKMRNIAKKSGMNLSSAIKLYINQTVISGHMPFQYSPSIELDLEVEEARRDYDAGKLKGFSNTHDLMKFLKK